MKSTLSTARGYYGSCSSEFASIVRAWEDICVETGIKPSDLFPACSFVLEDINPVCEEDDGLTICLLNGQGSGYTWKIIGKNSTSFVMSGSQSGNTTIGSSCLEITDFPKYPYYPQYITIQVNNPSIAGNTVFSRQIKLNDCNNDDPDCEDYYSSPLPISSSNEPTSNRGKTVKFAIYNLLGQEITNGNISEFNNDILPQGILIFVGLDSSNRIVESKKICIIQ